MRRILVASAAVLAFLAVIPAHAAPVTGSILLSGPQDTIFVNPRTPGFQMCAFQAAGDQAQGLWGWKLPVTGGDTFNLTAVGGTTEVPGFDNLPDFDIYFYTNTGLPKCDSPTTPTVPLGKSTAPGDEIEQPVPAGAAFGIIILFLGAPGSSFVYETV